MPERPERRDRSIDVVALRLGVAAGRVMAVGERHLPDRAGNRHGELATRVGDAREDVGDRVGPSSPGTQASRIAAQCAAAHSMASGRPLTTTSTTGVPVATTASRSSCWRPRNPSVERSRNSPVVESSVSPERSPRTTIATSAARAVSTASASSRRSPSEIPVPRGVGDLGADEPRSGAHRGSSAARRARHPARSRRHPRRRRAHRRRTACC